MLTVELGVTPFTEVVDEVVNEHSNLLSPAHAKTIANV